MTPAPTSEQLITEKLLETLAPGIVGWLQIPLTPSRKAALAAFQVRNPGVDPVKMILDFLDDEIFALPERASSENSGR